MKHSRTIILSLILTTGLLNGCAYTGYAPVQAAPYPAQTYPSAPYQYSAYGVIDSIQRVDAGAANAGPGIGAGTIIGGVVGGLLGNRIGGGDGNKIAIATGAVGGAIIGNQMERQNTAPLPAYQIGVRMENGSFQTYTQDSIAGLAVGSQVRIDNGRVYRY